MKQYITYSLAILLMVAYTVSVVGVGVHHCHCEHSQQIMWMGSNNCCCQHHRHHEAQHCCHHEAQPTACNNTCQHAETTEGIEATTGQCCTITVESLETDHDIPSVAQKSGTDFHPGFAVALPVGLPVGLTPAPEAIAACHKPPPLPFLYNLPTCSRTAQWRL